MATEFMDKSTSTLIVLYCCQKTFSNKETKEFTLLCYFNPTPNNLKKVISDIQEMPENNNYLAT